MRVMVFIKATEESEAGALPPTEAFEAMDRITEEMVRAGVFVAGAGLKPSAQGKRIAFEGAGHTVTDGPFTGARDLVAGFCIWEVRDMDEAVAWASRFPNPGGERGEIEIRPFFEAADLAHVLPQEPADAAPRDPVRQKLGVA